MAQQAVNEVLEAQELAASLEDLTKQHIEALEKSVTAENALREAVEKHQSVKEKTDRLAERKARVERLLHERTRTMTYQPYDSVEYIDLTQTAPSLCLQTPHQTQQEDQTSLEAVLRKMDGEMRLLRYKFNFANFKINQERASTLKMKKDLSFVMKTVIDCKRAIADLRRNLDH